MLDFIYYPVSAILWFWHQAFGYVLGKNSGFAWALAVVFLVFTLRLVLYKPFVKQVRTTRQMQELQPQIKELQKKYKNDRQEMTVQMQKLQKEHGFNPLMGCLPVLLQVPVFIGLFHVLRSFNRVGGSSGLAGFGATHGMTAEQNANTANYIFSPAEVQSFLSARLFGAPLSSFITQPMTQLESYAHWGGMPSKVAIAAVSIPLMVIAGIATHMNARASVARQSPEAAAQPQAAMMNKLALYVFPLGVMVGGPFLPVAILIYWVSNNIWTYGQQHLVFGKIEKEDEEKKRIALERRAQNAPKPGAKPVDVRKKQTGKVEDAPVDGVEDAKTDAPQASTNGAKPAPGAKPAGSKKRSGNRGRANQKRRR
ncbi:membrane protein insertase YidC [Nocardia sp. ET3-3]|uniref:Membrane protein insertase YidC n=1 Tax=Nocardia terrae TaxID=2675851 RepID=A0A7K1UZQ0_9NOCA|nr:membrane protein insertase YidC [Nocardia terrae]